MKVLLTGATGFLGKYVLNLLLADPRVTQVVIPTRVRRTHPNEKVTIVQLDLTDIAQVEAFEFDGDAVIHLAGLYDFSRTMPDNYSQNVVNMLNMIALLERLNQTKRVPVYYASSYSVGLGYGKVLDESPLERVPPKQSQYAFTKAIAEKLLTDSFVPAFVFRLGILVGSETDGEILKTDGPYEFLKQLILISKLPGSRHLRRIPIPSDRKGLLPLVPVNQAAEVFHQALFHPELQTEWQKIFGVYNTDSLGIAEFCEIAVPRFLKNARPHFIEKLPSLQIPLLALPAVNLIKSRLLRFGALQRNVEAFRFALDPVKLSNGSFVRYFGKKRISNFRDYQEVFFRGFSDYLLDQVDEEARAAGKIQAQGKRP
ncbi:MAG: SDR family oxidoreductase [Methylotenera sp.]|nr:SDR family oxidoreductase [Oligoflexia bacterium]